MPIGLAFERKFGLGLLYIIRGDLPAPRGALVIALDEDSLSWLQRNARSLPHVSNGLSGCLTPHALDVLEQSRNANLVPRALYACLLEELLRRRVSGIVFDIKFNAVRPDDEMFAKTISEAGNVLLLEGYKPSGLIQLTRPTERLLSAARGTGFFAVNGAGGRIATGYADKIPHFPSAETIPHKALGFLDTYASRTKTADDIELIWYYGGPLTVPTIPIRAVFEKTSNAQLPDDLSDVVVFVGVSDPGNANAPDHFRTPMLQFSPRQTGGVELAATAFLNLLHEQRLTKLSPFAWFLFSFISVAAVLLPAISLGGRRAVILSGTALGAYTLGAALIFGFGGVWVPLATPILVGGPLAFVCGLFVRYSNAAALVGRLAPAQIAPTLLKLFNAQRGIKQSEEATVMFIDLQGSTSLAETIAPEEFEKVLNIYYDEAAAAIEHEDGMVVDFMGDGILAIFTETIAGPKHATKACRAAIFASEGVNVAWQEHYAEALESIRLRFGLHSGSVVTGLLGSSRRFGYDALGDTVNTAARIEPLGKTIADDGSDVILLSHDTKQRVGSLHVEMVMRTQLSGRKAETDIYRLISIQPR